MITGPCSLDTSVAMRLLVGAPESQYERAKLFLGEQRSSRTAVHVSDQVLAEASFSLDSDRCATGRGPLESPPLF